MSERKKYTIKETKTLGHKPVKLFQIWRDGNKPHYVEGYFKISEIVPLWNVLSAQVSKYFENQYTIEVHDVELSVTLEGHCDPYGKFEGHSIAECALLVDSGWVPFEPPESWEDEIIELVEEAMCDEAIP